MILRARPNCGSLRGFIDARNRTHRRPHRTRQAESRDRNFRHCRVPGCCWTRPVQDYEARGLAAVSRAQMRRIAKKLARLSLEERRKVSGVGPRRAEIIIAGAAVYAELLERCKLQGFRYSPLGLRDGLLAQMAAEYDRSTRSGKQIESERGDSIRNAVEHYRVDLDHALKCVKPPCNCSPH